MTIDTKKFKDLLVEHKISLRKSLGQNFLVDPNIPEKIVRLSGVTDDCCVLEIGPGFGALTIELCKTAKSVIAVELDAQLMPILYSVLDSFDNCWLIQGDFLKLEIDKLINEDLRKMPCVVCANLPYGIATPILTTLFESSIFDDITVMIQREVARRICAKPGTADYGAFSIFANYRSVPSILFDVPPECFVPRPKVHSSVVRMKVRKDRLLEPECEKYFFFIVRKAFEQRRKMLVNTLYYAFNNSVGKTEIEKVLVSCGFSPQVRGETLSIDEFIQLSKVVYEDKRFKR